MWLLAVNAFSFPIIQSLAILTQTSGVRILQVDGFQLVNCSLVSFCSCIRVVTGSKTQLFVHFELNNHPISYIMFQFKPNSHSSIDFKMMSKLCWDFTSMWVLVFHPPLEVKKFLVERRIPLTRKQFAILCRQYLCCINEGVVLTNTRMVVLTSTASWSQPSARSGKSSP